MNAPAALLPAMAASWPSREHRVEAGLVLRDDAPEAGSRVRSGLVIMPDPPANPAVDALERYYQIRGGPALLQAARARAESLAAPGVENALEAALAQRGFAPFDPCLFAIGETKALACAPAPEGVRLLSVSAPLARLETLWEEGEIGPARRAVMARAIAMDQSGLASVIAARIADRIVAAAFLAPGGGDTAFLHALHVGPEARRRGAARGLVHYAALLSAEAGRGRLIAATRLGNAPARALFARCRMVERGGYFYWRQA